MDRRRLERQAIKLALQVACLLFTGVGVAHAAAPAQTTQHCAAPFAVVVAVRGEVRYRVPQQAWHPAALDQALCAGDELQVANGSRAALRLSNGSTVPLAQNTHSIIRRR